MFSGFDGFSHHWGRNVELYVAAVDPVTWTAGILAYCVLVLLGITLASSSMSEWPGTSVPRRLLHSTV